MKIQVEYILVGQGLAGTIISSILEEQGRTFVIFDQGHAGTSSSIAAGIINPITGRRFVKSWMFDTLVKHAVERYQILEQKLKIPIISGRNIIRQIPDYQSENDWLAKASHPGFRNYFVENPALETISEVIDISGLWSEVTNCYKVDIPSLIYHYRKYLSKAGILYAERFDKQLLKRVDSTWWYQDIESKNVVFCEGAGLAENTLFRSDFLNPSKGEVLLLKIPGFAPPVNIKKKFFLVPWEQQTFWFGAKDGWHFADQQPSKDGYDILLEHAKTMIKKDFVILDHLAAIRPTIKDRRPVIGPHETLKNLYLFNGLGTKGASLAPYWAEKLIDHIESGSPLMREVVPQRFK